MSVLGLDVPIFGLDASVFGIVCLMFDWMSIERVYCWTGCVLLLDWTCPVLDRMCVSVRLSAHNDKAFFDTF